MTFRVLVLDSGSTRGIIEALVLQKLSQISGKHPTDMFDLFVGSSTGTIVGSLLNLKDEVTGLPKYTAEDIVNFYKNESSQLLQTSLYRKLATCYGLFGSVYYTGPRDKKLNEVFGQAKLKESIKDSLYVSFDLTTQKTVLFKSRKAKLNEEDDYLVQDVLKACTAAPSIFPPYQYKSHLFVDNIFAKNPLIYALIESSRQHNVSFDDLHILSIGSGNFDPSCVKKAGEIAVTGSDFILNIFDSVLASSNELSIYVTDHLLTENSTFLRMDPDLPPELLGICDRNPITIAKIMKLTEDYILQNEIKFIEFVKGLERN